MLGSARWNPGFAHSEAGLHEQDFLALPMVDSVPMKLSSYCDKERVHVRGMDAAELIMRAWSRC